TPSVRSGCYRLLRAGLPGRRAVLVDLLFGGQVVYRGLLFAVTVLLVVKGHLRPALIVGGVRHFLTADGASSPAGRCSVGLPEVPSRDAVDDLDLDPAFAHGSLLLR